MRKNMKIYLDTCTINALTGLDNKEFDLLRSVLEKTNSRLYASHIQVDERYTKNSPDFEKKCEKAFERLVEHGIEIKPEATKAAVYGISKYGLSKWSDIGIEKIRIELMVELEKCNKEKGKYPPIENIIKDFLIAVTSADYDYFITSDDCLYRSWRRILEKNETRDILGRASTILYVKPVPTEILNQMTRILESRSSM
jgi:hypothetical protein